MEDKTVLERYAYYFDILKKMGEVEPTDTLTIENLGIPSGIIQRAYKEMKEMSFEGNVIDYLCYISTEYFLYELSQDAKRSVGVKKQRSEKAFYSIAKLSRLRDDNDDLIFNTIRLFVRNPLYFLKSDFYIQLKNYAIEDLDQNCLMDAMIFDLVNVNLTALYLKKVNQKYNVMKVLERVEQPGIISKYFMTIKENEINRKKK